MNIHIYTGNESDTTDARYEIEARLVPSRDQFRHTNVKQRWKITQSKE